MAMANYGRVGFYTFKAGTLDPLLAKAKQELPPMMERQPGFLRYAVVRTGPDSIASLSAWETREQSDAAAAQLVGWVRENFGPDLDTVENHIGENVLSDWSSGSGLPTWGRVSNYVFTRPAAELIPLVRDGYLPLLKQQPGFGSYTVWQTGTDSCVSFVTFGSKGEGEAAGAAVLPWLHANVAADTKAVQRLDGDLVWVVRKG